MIAGWRLDLNRILHTFNVGSISSVRLLLTTLHPQTELVINTNVVVSDVHQGVANTHAVVTSTHTIVSEIHRTMTESQGGTDSKNRSPNIAQNRSAISNIMGSAVLLLHSISSGEAPPPPPRACFGRDELIRKVVGLAENFTPIALIGAGGIGKTSIALTILHHHRIKQHFGDNRRFIRCDQFPASRTHFLNRLSEVIGAGVENPESLTPLRPFLSSKEMILVLDNAESILDPQGTDAREIYRVVEELGQFETLCLCITSRISTVPRYCKRPEIHTLSLESACDIFYGICDHGGRSDTINNLLKRLDFHALSITLLATTASHNMWDYDRLAQEWNERRVQVLQTDYDESLAATIELSLASSTFFKLGPDARDLLGVIAFFPQGIAENNLNWLFPAVPDRKAIFDKFCVLSLTHRSDGFVTMLAPLRDYLRPQDPASSPLLCAIKQQYFTRLLVDVGPGDPGFEDAQWIISEDANVEHLLDVFTTIDTSSDDVWEVCCYFMEHLYWHKIRLVVLGPKMEALPDDHRVKPRCLYGLSNLLNLVENQVERKRLLSHALGLYRQRGDDDMVAQALRQLSDTNRQLGLYEEGILQAREALEISKRIGDESEQVWSWRQLAWLLYDDGQLTAAEEAAYQSINLSSEKGDQFQICICHRLLGHMCRSKGETEKAIDHYETALQIASPSNWRNEQFWNHLGLAVLFFRKERFSDAHVQIEQAKLHAASDIYCMGRAMELQAEVWCKEHRFGAAKYEALQAAAMYGKIGSAKDVEHCRAILRAIEEFVEIPSAPGELGSNGPGEILK